MLMRNLTLIRFPTTLDWRSLEQQLTEHALKPVGPLEWASYGVVSPFGDHGDERLHHHQGHHLWLTIGRLEKVIPAAALNLALDVRLAEIEQREGRRPGGRERRRIKDDLLHELLPRAMVTAGRWDVLLDTKSGLGFIDTATAKFAETVISHIRQVLGSFPAVRVNAQVAPRTVLTSWIAGQPLPEGLTLGEQCELRDPVQGGAVARFQQQELRSDEIDQHLDAGKQASQLALVMDDSLSFVLGENLVVRKLKFLDGALDRLDRPENNEGMAAEFAARVALQIGELGRLFALLETAFSITPADGQGGVA